MEEEEAAKVSKGWCFREMAGDVSVDLIDLQSRWDAPRTTTN